MSYPLDLDEIDSPRLEKEIAYRRRMHAEGKCDYCAQPHDAKPCKFPGRHAGLLSPTPLPSLPVLPREAVIPAGNGNVLYSHHEQWFCEWFGVDGKRTHERVEVVILPASAVTLAPPTEPEKT